MTGQGGVTGPDGRSRRWEAHRDARRTGLIEAAAAAIEERGPHAHLEDIAAAAGVSKPVLYRYFKDKDDLLAATARWAADELVGSITAALAGDPAPREAIAAAVETYLEHVERRRNLFLLVIHHRAREVDGSVAEGKSAAAVVLARALANGLRLSGVEPGGAETWAHALVGLGVSTAEWWLETGTLTREEVAAYLTDFVWHAFDGISRGR